MAPNTHHAEHFLESLQIAGWLARFYLLLLFLRPVILRDRLEASSDAIERIFELHSRYSLSAFAIQGDKHHLLVAEERGLVAYASRGTKVEAFCSWLPYKNGTGDYKTLINLARQAGSAQPILAGISGGAGLSVLAATDPEVKTTIQGILALGLPDQNELGWKWQDFTIWITKKVPDEPSFRVEDIINRVSPIPLAEIHSTRDEFLPLDLAKTMFSKGGEPKKMWIIEASNQRFSDNRDELDRRLLEAIEWIKKVR